MRLQSLKPGPAQLLPEAQAWRFRALMLEDTGTSLRVGMAYPSDMFTCDELTRILNTTPRRL